MKRVTVYPEPRTLKILGQSTPQLNLALDCWARQVLVGAAEVESLLNQAEWMYLADCLNGHAADAREDRGSLVLSVNDANELDGLGEKWFGSEAREHVDRLKAKLGGLSYPAVWAVQLAVNFFWNNHEALDVRSEWWRVAFRTRWKQAEYDETTDGSDTEEGAA